jgi:dihydrofolate synthase/folylpolyglutamate synthase
MEDKDLPGIASALAPLASRAFATRVDAPRARPAAEVARALGTAGVPHVEQAEPADALRRARDAAGPGGLVLATGSVYLAGAIRGLVRAGSAAVRS